LILYVGHQVRKKTVILFQEDSPTHAWKGVSSQLGNVSMFEENII
jgi:hypothetical protein